MDDDLLDLYRYRWVVPVGAEEPLPSKLRALEGIVIEEAGPALRDPVLQEHAVAYSLRKGTDGEAPGGPCGLGLEVMAPAAAADAVRDAVARHLRSSAALEEAPGEEPDLLLHPICTDYRRGLREVTDVALDLHHGPERLRKHQCALIGLACTATDPRFGLHAYLMEHSPAYVALSGVRDEPKNIWKHEEFWMRLFTPGPAVRLARPLEALWNIVLGLTPRRWNDPAAVARSMGIRCA